MNQSRAQILCQYKITDLFFLSFCPSLYHVSNIFWFVFVISEIGTGFYVEKESSETIDFLERKLKIVDANSENITKAVQATRQNIDRYVTLLLKDIYIYIYIYIERERERNK